MGNLLAAPKRQGFVNYHNSIDIFNYGSFVPKIHAKKSAHASFGCASPLRRNQNATVLNGPIFAGGKHMSNEHPIVRDLARQMVTEYGGSAQSVVRGFIERCRAEGDFAWVQNWEAVRGALPQFQLSAASKY
jgi:hypothetical protein